MNNRKNAAKVLTRIYIYIYIVKTRDKNQRWTIARHDLLHGTRIECERDRQLDKEREIGDFLLVSVPLPRTSFFFFLLVVFVVVIVVIVVDVNHVRETWLAKYSTRTRVSGFYDESCCPIVHDRLSPPVGR